MGVLCWLDAAHSLPDLEVHDGHVAEYYFSLCSICTWAPREVTGRGVGGDACAIDGCAKLDLGQHAPKYVNECRLLFRVLYAHLLELTTDLD